MISAEPELEYLSSFGGGTDSMVDFDGLLIETRRDRLFENAYKCPVRRTLSIAR